MCLFVCFSIFLYVRLFFCASVWSSASNFDDNKNVTHNFTQRMRPQATDSNILSGIIVYPSVHTSGCPWAFCNFFICIHYLGGFQSRNSFIPTLGSEGPQCGPVKLMCPSVYLSISLYISLTGCLHRFLEIICAAHNCAQHIWPQATGSNPLNGSRICLSVCQFGCPQAFLPFLYLYSYPFWGSSMQRFIYWVSYSYLSTVPACICTLERAS